MAGRVPGADGPVWPMPVAVGTWDPDARVVIRRAVPGQRHPDRDRDGQRVVYLDGEQRARLWAGLRAHDPALAALIESDVIQSLRQEFGAELMLRPDELRRYLGAE